MPYEDVVKSIEELHRLKSAGIITDAEFEQSKQQLLFGRGKPTATRPDRFTGLPAFTGELPPDSDHLGWITLPLRRYAEFTGRSGRKEFWMFQLLPVGLFFSLFAIGFTFAGGVGEGTAGGFALGVVLLAALGLIIPQLALQVRRLHDQDRSGWLVALNLVPYIGPVAIFILMLMEGTVGENKYGPDPYGPDTL
jgi:uncharacterized membrane protein YhaH (DUF805 family)